MSWQDFQIHFRSIYVCRVYPPEMRYSVHSQWRGYSAAGCQDYETWHQNPQFRLRAIGADASLPIHVFITLTQVMNKPLLAVAGSKTCALSDHEKELPCRVSLGRKLLENNSWFQELSIKPRFDDVLHRDEDSQDPWTSCCLQYIHARISRRN